MEYVYHAVTERPMVPGQILLFDESHHNGVYNRVMTCKRMIDGEPIDGEVARLISGDPDKWTGIMFREVALEKVRSEEYPDCPSRMACLYTSRTLREAKGWAAFFANIGRDVYSIVKLRVDGNLFDGDACNCFRGTGIEPDDLEKAHHYWKKDIVNKKPIIETLVNGNICVEEIVLSYR